MARSGWLLRFENTLKQHLSSKMSGRRTRSRRTYPLNPAPQPAEVLEQRSLLSASAVFVEATGELSIELDSSESAQVSSVNGNVLIGLSNNGSPYVPFTGIGTIPAASIVSLNIFGGDDANTIDLSNVTLATYSNLTSLQAFGDDGNDVLIGSPDLASQLFGEDGHDSLTGGAADDVLNGGDGNDTIVGNAGNDSITAGDGADTVVAGDGNDTISGGNGNDTVSAGNGDDSVVGQNGQDSLLGDAGNDTINGDGGFDTLSGGDGNDFMLGGDLSDSLVGGAGNDTLVGNSGNDTLVGVTGADIADGGLGDDLIRSALETPVNDPIPAPARPAPLILMPAPLPDAVDSTLGTDTSAVSTTIGSGMGDGSLMVQVTSTGAFGIGSFPTTMSAGAPYDPIGGLAAGDTTTDSQIYFRANTVTGTRSTIDSLATNLTTIRATSSEANSSFDIGPLHFVLTQVAEPVFDVATTDAVGSLLTQTYRITNTGTASLEFELARFLDGRLRFNGSTTDGGGRFVSTAGDEFLVETDAGGLSATGNFVGITAKGGTIPTTNRFQIEQATALEANLLAGQPLTGQVFNDTNGDQSTDANYDVSLGLRNTFQLAANGTVTYTTHTLFGTGTPNQVQLNQKPVSVADTGTALENRSVVIDVVSNDFDVDDSLDFASVQITQQPINGIATSLGDGRVSFIPNMGFFGTDSFAYTIADTLGARSNPATVTVTVNAQDVAGDLLNGGIGNDTILGSFANDTILAGSGQDSLDGGEGDDRVLGQGGNDTVIGGGGLDTLDGGDGSDLVQSVAVGLVINDVTIAEGDLGSANAVFTVGLTTASEQTVTVNFATSGGTATSGLDFTATSGTLTFLPGVITQTISVPVLGDTLQETSEGFFVTLTSAVNAVIVDDAGQGTITDNDVPTFTLTPGANVNASRLASTQGEVDIAVNPTNTQNVVVVANGGTSDPSAQFIANSMDGGATWTIRPLSFTQDGVSTVNSDRFDAAVAFDRFGNLHLTYMARAQSNGNVAILHGISGDGGTTFVTTVLEALGTGFDKPWIATGPDAANPMNEAVYITYRTATGLVARGAVATGLGNVGAFTAATQFTMVGNFAVPSVGPNGEFVVTWQNPSDGQGPGVALFDRDLNGLVGGLTFGADSVITTTNLGGSDFIPATPDRSTFASPYLAYDLSSGVHRGRLYCAYGEEIIDESNNSDILVRFSDDNGTTWSQPVRVNDDVGVNSQFFQDISVDPVTGTVFLSWYDARNDIGGGGIDTDGRDNTDVQVFMSASIYVGSTLTFAPNVLVSRGASNQARDVNDPGNDFGDYMGISANNNVIYVGWVDNSNSTNDNPGGTGTFEVYTSRVTASINTVSVPSGGSVGTPLAIADAGDLMRGSDGDDTIFGAVGDDTISGGAGNDVIGGGGGNDLILGGSDNDTLSGGDGNDTLDGQGGNDVLSGDGGDDVLVLGNGSGGDDVIEGGEGFNQIQVNGTVSSDNITIGANNGLITVSRGLATVTANNNMSVQRLVVNAGAGDDTVTVNDLASIDCAILIIVNGDEGNDRLTAQGSRLGLARLMMNGGVGNDTILGSQDGDSLNGNEGTDAINGLAGNDSITGTAGNDVLAGGLGDDTLDGGDGEDFITGNAGNDRIRGGAGNDTLRGFEGDDILDGQSGDDNLNGMDGNDVIRGGVGKDQIVGGSGDDSLDGGRNDDSINGNSGNDSIVGDHGNDFISAGDGNNTVYGGDGNDTILSEGGDDIVVAGDGNDLINTDGGNDLILGGDGNDSVQAGGGNDTILGGDGDDVLNGQSGSDVVAGQQGIDVISDSASEIIEAFSLTSLSSALLKILGGPAAFPT